MMPSSSPLNIFLNDLIRDSGSFYLQSDNAKTLSFSETPFHPILENMSRELLGDGNNSNEFDGSGTCKVENKKSEGRWESTLIAPASRTRNAGSSIARPTRIPEPQSSSNESSPTRRLPQHTDSFQILKSGKRRNGALIPLPLLHQPSTVLEEDSSQQSKSVSSLSTGEYSRVKFAAKAFGMLDPTEPKTGVKRAASMPVTRSQHKDQCPITPMRYTNKGLEALVSPTMFSSRSRTVGRTNSSGTKIEPSERRRKTKQRQKSADNVLTSSKTEKPKQRQVSADYVLTRSRDQSSPKAQTPSQLLSSTQGPSFQFQSPANLVLARRKNRGPEYGRRTKDSKLDQTSTHRRRLVAEAIACTVPPSRPTRRSSRESTGDDGDEHEISSVQKETERHKALRSLPSKTLDGTAASTPTLLDLLPSSALVQIRGSCERRMASEILDDASEPVTEDYEVFWEEVNEYSREICDKLNKAKEEKIVSCRLTGNNFPRFEANRSFDSDADMGKIKPKSVDEQKSPSVSSSKSFGSSERPEDIIKEEITNAGSRILLCETRMSN